MLKVTVCIGSSCHLKGSRDVVERLEELITQNDLKDEVDLGGTFSMGKFTEGVCVMVNDVLHSVTPGTTEAFFKKEILKAEN